MFDHGPCREDQTQEAYPSCQSNRLREDPGGTICLRDLKDAIRNGGARTPTRRRQQLELPTSVGAEPTTPGGASPAGATTPARQLLRAPSGVLSDLFGVLDANGHEKVYYSDFLAATL